MGLCETSFSKRSTAYSLPVQSGYPRESRVSGMGHAHVRYMVSTLQEKKREKIEMPSSLETSNCLFPKFDQTICSRSGAE